jgi:class 3 adenylate cyclase
LPQLVVVNGVCEGTVFVLPEVPTVVGRSPESHLQVGDPWISSMHALFERRGDELWIVDLDSRNGTFLGEARVDEARLDDGAVVRLGQTELRVELRAAGAPPRAAGPTPPPEPRRGGPRTDATLSVRNPLVVREAPADPYALALRRATVLRMALDADGVEALPDAPERLRAALEAAARAALDAGGVVTRLAGVGVLGLYGLDGAAAHDAARALGAARAARRAVRAAGGLDLRAAVDTGPVIAGNAAGAAGFELAALGDTAERVERLLAAARRGEILAGPGTAETGGLVSAGLRRVGETEIEVFRAEDDPTAG